MVISVAAALNGEPKPFPPPSALGEGGQSVLQHGINLATSSMNSCWSSLTELDEGAMQKVEMLSGAVIVLSLSVAYLPDHGVFKWPFKAIWRVMLGIALSYSFFLTYLLVNYNREDAIQFLGWLDPSLGKPLPEKNYADNCELWDSKATNPLHNFLDRIDIFIACHLFGWMWKTIIIRDAGLVWYLSILFEFIEISFRHLLPNFYECWWDSLLLDVLGCNALGIWLGMKVVRKLGLEEYNWGFPRGGWWSDHRKLIVFLFMTIFVELLDTTLFFIKYELWMPTSHWILVCRTFFWAFYAPPCTTELYKLLNGKLGTFPLYLVVGTIIQCLELGLCIKYGRGVFHESMPNNIRAWWIVIWTIAIAHAIQLRIRESKETRNGESVHNRKVASSEKSNN
ncbi:hypothetical protein FOZ61_010251 [Perkinsus olseni]|uniref:Phosphatidylserine synthase 2 n=1 Tax=Perkinsus olseni TaxID=32597 RepID=A0A7J6M3G5_PEROL|nr:hypothetical protein FOZ61_010251 [Perkinsus olseni]